MHIQVEFLAETATAVPARDLLYSLVHFDVLLEVAQLAKRTPTVII